MDLRFIYQKQKLGYLKIRNSHTQSVCSVYACRTRRIDARGPLTTAAYRLVTTSSDVPNIPDHTPTVVCKVIRQ